MMKRYLIIAALLAALAVAAVAMRSTARQNEGAPAYPPVKVALAPALREQAARSYAGVGELEAASRGSGGGDQRPHHAHSVRIRPNGAAGTAAGAAQRCGRAG